MWMWTIGTALGVVFLLSACKLAGGTKNEAIWQALRVCSIFGLLAAKFLDPADGGCFADWDGRANPTVCE